MNKKTQRIIIGTVVPLLIACATISYSLLHSRDDSTGLAELVGGIFMFGIVLMCVPAFIMSCLAEALNTRITSHIGFLLVGGVAGFACSLILSLVEPSALGVMLYGAIGSAVGSLTALVLRLHLIKCQK